MSVAREDINPAPPTPPEKSKPADADKKDEKKDDADKPAEPKADEPAKDGAAKPAAKAKEAKKPDWGKRWSEALRFTIEQVASADTDVRRAVPSPDGRALLFVKGLGDLTLLNLETGARRELYKSWDDDQEAIWASDSRHVIYAVQDLDFNSDIWLLNTGGAEGASSTDELKPINLTRHPDSDSSPRLSADGKVLTFLSERGSQEDQFDVYQIYLDRELEGMTAYERDDYFKKAGEAAAKRKPAETPAFVLKKLGWMKDEPKPEGEKKDAKPAPKAEALKFDADEAYMRVRRITSTPGSEGDLALTPGGDRIIYSGASDSESALVSVDHKGGDRKVLQAGSVRGVGVSITGDKVSFVRTGAAFSTPSKGGKVDAWPVDAPVVLDIPAQQRQKFLELARTFGDRFYHPTMKGLDWPALTRRYLVLAEKTRTSAEFNRAAEMLFGEVDGSHTGASGGPGFSTSSPATGYLGVRVKPVAGGYEIVNVTPDSPAAMRSSRLNAGDVLISVEGQRFAPDEASVPNIDLDAAMAGRAGRETLIEVKRAARPATAEPAEDGKAEPVGTESEKKSDGVMEHKLGTLAGKFVVITPASSGAWMSLRYQEEVRLRREQVEKLSKGRLGYLHIRSMSQPEVREFERDLYAAAHGKDGLIIDVRDNGGGSTADILLSSLTAPRHAWTVPRGADPKSVPQDAYPRDRRLIYGYTRPLDVLINQHSFSNAEIFAHAIKTTGRGRAVGTATFGGVISTGAFSLIDGTMVRMPFRGWYLPDGTDMENNGCKPDVDVPQTPADEAAGKDPQIEAAVTDLLKRIDKE